MTWQKEGFLSDESMDVNHAMQVLAVCIEKTITYYQQLSESELLLKPAPGKWSPKQIIGHLIDSAINNLKRFTEAQFKEQPYVIIAYQQNELMEVNHYQELPVAHLLSLWQSLNHQIMEVVKRIPADTLKNQVVPQYDQTGTKTLEWLICDYVAHMYHHLQTIIVFDPDPK